MPKTSKRYGEINRGGIRDTSLRLALEIPATIRLVLARRLSVLSYDGPTMTIMECQHDRQNIYVASTIYKTIYIKYIQVKGM